MKPTLMELAAWWKFHLQFFYTIILELDHWPLNGNPPPPPSPVTSLPPPTPLAPTPPPSRGSRSVLNLKKFLGINMVSENQQTVNSLSRSWVSEHIKCSNRPKYCKLIRPSPFFSPFTVIRLTQIFGIFKRKKKFNHFLLEIILLIWKMSIVTA